MTWKVPRIGQSPTRLSSRKAISERNSSFAISEGSPSMAGPGPNQRPRNPALIDPNALVEVAAPAALVEDARIDVAGQDLDIVARGIRHQREHRQRHRIRLFAARAAGRPQPDSPAATCLRQ